MKKILIMSAALMALTVSGCTHRKVDVTQFGDKDKSCSEIKAEIESLEKLEREIDEKTGLSGRNVGMALLFWPGIIVNEMNADDASDRAAERKEKLFALYSQKSCS